MLDRLPRLLKRPLLRALSRRARLRCVSEELAQLVRGIAGLPLPGTLHVEPAPIDISSAPTREAARAELGIAASMRLVVIVSRLLPGKRVRTALDAVCLLPGVQAVVVGDGPELGALQSEYPRVRFVGRVARPRALSWIAAADALLSASRLEGAPSAIREARALAVPVASCSAGDLALWAELDDQLWVVS